MKLASKSDLAKMTAKDLAKHLDELTENIQKLSFESRTNQKANMHLSRNYKKQIARVKTLMSQSGKES